MLTTAKKVKYMVVTATDMGEKLVLEVASVEEII